MSNSNESLGKASLWSSIIGVVLPGCLAVLVVIFLKPPKEQGTAYGICGVIFVILELIALGCGIAARRTATGKAGLVISTTLLLLPVLAAVVQFFSGSSDKPARGDGPPPMVRPPDKRNPPPVEGAK